ncbi:hypothetical protein BS78_K343800, partial [Paspalum vaginatum]
PCPQPSQQTKAWASELSQPPQVQESRPLRPQLFPPQPPSLHSPALKKKPPHTPDSPGSCLTPHRTSPTLAPNQPPMAQHRQPDTLRSCPVWTTPQPQRGTCELLAVQPPSDRTQAKPHR